MKAIAILNLVVFYSLGVAAGLDVVPVGFGLPLLLISLFFAWVSVAAVRGVENTIAVATVYATGVNPQTLANDDGQKKTASK